MARSTTRRSYMREQTSAGGWIPPLILAMLLGGTALYFSRKAKHESAQTPHKPASAVTLAVANSDDGGSDREPDTKKGIRALLPSNWGSGKSQDLSPNANAKNAAELLADGTQKPANAFKAQQGPESPVKFGQDVTDRVVRVIDGAQQEVAKVAAAAEDSVRNKVSELSNSANTQEYKRADSTTLQMPSAQEAVDQLSSGLLNAAKHAADGATTQVNDLLESQSRVRSPVAESLVPISAPQQEPRPPVAPGALASPLLNHTTGPYEFIDLKNEKQSSNRFRDKVAVLVWFNNHPSSQTTLRQLESVYQQYQGRPDVDFLAVCVEPMETMSHQDLQQLTKSWSVQMPVVRDLQAHGRDIFQIQQAPTLVALGKDGTVQVVEVGAGPELARQLPAVIDRLVAGENLAAAYLQHLARPADPSRDSSAGGQEPDVARQELRPPGTQPTLAIARRSEPTRFKMTKLWHSTELQQPGNILYLPDSQAGAGATLLVHDGQQQVVRLGVDGQVLDRYQLPVEKSEAITALDSALDGDGRRYYAGTAKTAGRVYVFDANFRLLFRYPNAAAGTASPGIHDSHLVDLDRDGNLELYVGFDGTEGLHRVDLQGQNVWRKSDVSPVLSMAVAADGTQYKLLITGQHGRIIPVDPLGRDSQPIQVGERTIHRLWPSSADSPRPTVFLGTVNAVVGATVATGLSTHLNELWSYRLPEGQFTSQIRPVTTARLGNDQTWHWILAGPDGSVHIVADDGLMNDDFNFGEPITGIAAFNSDGRPSLVLATAKGLSAWSLSPANLGTARRGE